MHETNPAQMLHSELTCIRRMRIGLAVAAGVNGLALLSNLFTRRLSPDLSTACLLMVLTGVFGQASLRFGSRTLFRRLRDGQHVPSPAYVEAVLSAMQYWGAQKLAMEKMRVLLPALSRETLCGVDRRLWRRLYAYASHAPIDQKHIAFEAALAIQDRQSLPYLQRVLCSRDLPEDVRADLASTLGALQECGS
jgi:hypothetical protein